MSAPLGTFWMVRRRGADDDAWESVLEEATARSFSGRHFEVVEVGPQTVSLIERIKAELHSDEDGTTRLAGPLGDAISVAAGSCSLEFVTPEQLAEGICNWIAMVDAGKEVVADV